MGEETGAEDPRVALVFDESVRAITQQQDALAALHNRVGLVLSGAAIASSLFATQILKGSSPSWLTWAALAAFVAVGASALFVLWPRKGWLFSNTVETLLSVWVDDEDSDIDAMRREIATYNQKSWDSNQKKLKDLYLGFQVASTALGIEVVIWLIDLGTR